MTGADIAQGIFTTITALGGLGAVVLLFRVRSENKKLTAEARKADADAVAVLSQSAISLLAPLRAEVAALQSKVSELNAQVRILSADLDAAHRRLREYGDTAFPLRPRP